MPDFPATGDPPELGQDDLARGAQLQLRGRLAMRSFERRIVPRSGLEVLATRTRLGGCDGECFLFFVEFFV